MVSHGRKKKIKLGLGLGGGGAKGSAHLGALRAFEEEGIEFDVVAGTSIGSIVGGLYAKGLSWREIDSIVANSPLNDAKSLLFARLSGMGVDEMLGSILGKMVFDELKKPFAAVAVDLDSGEKAVFTEGDLIKAFAASSAIAPYFPCVKINDHRYVDGAYRNIIPCDVVKNMGADFVVGIDLSGGRQSTENGKKLLDELYPDNGVPVCNPTEDGYAASDVMLAPDLKEFNSTSFSSLAEIFDIGYFTAKERMAEIKAAIVKKRN